MPQDTTPAAQLTRLDRLLVALSRDIQVTEGRELDYDTAEQMQRTINAARTELDRLTLDLNAATTLAA